MNNGIIHKGLIGFAIFVGCRRQHWRRIANPSTNSKPLRPVR